MDEKQKVHNLAHGLPVEKPKPKPKKERKEKP